MLTTKDILGRLKSLREEKDLRQGFVAKRLGVDRTTYVRKEQGKIPITTEEWIRLARLMDKNPAYFFGSALDEVFDADRRAVLLVKLYSTLKRRERDDLICGVHMKLKDIKRKAVADALKTLMEA